MAQHEIAASDVEQAFHGQFSDMVFTAEMAMVTLTALPLRAHTGAPSRMALSGEQLTDDTVADLLVHLVTALDSKERQSLALTSLFAGELDESMLCEDDDVFVGPLNEWRAHFVDSECDGERRLAAETMMVKLVRAAVFGRQASGEHIVTGDERKGIFFATIQGLHYLDEVNQERAWPYDMPMLKSLFEEFDTLLAKSKARS